MKPTIVDTNAIPKQDTTAVRKSEFIPVTIKGVLDGDKERDITVNTIPFNKRNDEHVRFAYAFSDMLFRAPSPFTDICDAAKAYVPIFVQHSSAEELDANSDYNLIYNDLRACRVLFNSPTIQKAFNDFFGND